MGIVVDLIIIAIVLLSTFLAYKKGMVKLAIQLCSFIIAIVLTFILYQPITNLVINATGIDEMIENTIYEKTNEIMQNGEENIVGNEMIESVKNEMLPETARNLSVNIVRGGVIIILFLGIRIALKFVTVLADVIAKLPIFTQLNKIGGIVYGILRGILIIYAAFLILNVFNQLNPGNSIDKSIEQSSVGKMMYENNILKVLFL